MTSPWTTVGATTPDDDVVWVWFSDCVTPRQFMLEMKVDGSVVHSSLFSACFTRRRENDGKQVSFAMPSRKSRFGETPGTPLEVDVWEAGGEETEMILGVTFMSKDRLWLNTLHYAEIDRPSTTNLARGIVLKTSPVKAASVSQSTTSDGESGPWRDEWRCAGLLGALPTTQIQGMKPYYDEKPMASANELAAHVRLLAESGDKDAQFVYATLLLTGRCVPQDVCAARRYRELSRGATKDWAKTYPIPREFETKEAETVCR